jgi:hypothetical protein
VVAKSSFLLHLAAVTVKSIFSLSTETTDRGALFRRGDTRAVRYPEKVPAAKTSCGELPLRYRFLAFGERRAFLASVAAQDCPENGNLKAATVAKNGLDSLPVARAPKDSRWQELEAGGNAPASPCRIDCQGTRSSECDGIQGSIELSRSFT